MIIPALLSSRPVRFIAWAVAGLVAFAAWTWAQRSAGARQARSAARIEQAESERQAHERINKADLGIGASDAERIERLRSFAARHGNGSYKAGGR